MRRYIQPLSTFSPKVPLLFYLRHGVDAGFQWQCPGQKRRRHGWYSRPPTHQLLSSTTEETYRWEQNGNSPIAKLLRENSVGYHTTTPTQADVQNASQDGSGSDVCQLFREIAVRIESADRNRKPPTPPETMQRRSTASLTSDFCETYISLPDKQSSSSSSSNNPKQEFIELLLRREHGVKEESILSAITNLRSNSLRDADILRIRELCTPQYESIFHYILGSAQQDLGVAFLVKLRRDVRDRIHYLKFVQRRENQAGEMTQQSKDGINQIQLEKLQTLERNIQTILTSLFRPGVLDLQRITYQETPASIIEQIAFKEAVHPLQSLQDLRTRLGPGRRCFAFFHPALPNKPLVFVHVALLQEIPSSMDDLQHASELDASCAAFYSITNTERGLAGVDLGNHLIKSVVNVLQNEFPKLDKFCTLSPIPNFRKWLEGKILRYHEGLTSQQQSVHGRDENFSDFSLKFMDDGLFCSSELQQLQEIFQSESSLLDFLETLKSPNWQINSSNGNLSHLVDQLEPILMKLAAYYLTIETRHGRPLCPVAKFHIRNGAEMHRLNYMADTSSKGMRNSCGIMINYRYVLNEIEANRVRYEISSDVMVRDGVKHWLDGTEKLE